MASTYSGSLQVKKKAELQEIAQALSVSDAGTRDELQQRIKKHLDDNADLEQHPTFTGLFSRKRQRSLQPSVTGSSAPSRATTKMEPIAESPREMTPVAEDMREISMMLPRAPLPPSSPPPVSPPRNSQLPATPSSLPPLPSSPAKSIIADVIAQPEVQAVVEMERNVVRKSTQVLTQTRNLLSNGRNIFIITALFDFASILATIHLDAPFPVPPINVQAAPALRAMSLATSYWALPAVILPTIIGYLISFSAGYQSGFDPLSASIVRVAANYAYDFPVMLLSDAEGSKDVQSLDVLGVKWRTLTASVTLAFAFAEAIGRSSSAQASRSSSPTATARDITP